jgi:hypothetical protein
MGSIVVENVPRLLTTREILSFPTTLSSNSLSLVTQHVREVNPFQCCPVQLLYLGQRYRVSTQAIARQELSASVELRHSGSNLSIEPGDIEMYSDLK